MRLGECVRVREAEVAFGWRPYNGAERVCPCVCMCETAGVRMSVRLCV